MNIAFWLTLGVVASVLLVQSPHVPKTQGKTVPASAPARTPAAPEPAPALPGNARVVLEGLAGEPKVVPLAGFETVDPRLLGAHLVRFEGLTPANVPAAGLDAAVLELAGGDRMCGSVRRGQGEMLDVEIAGGLHVSVTLDDIASLVFPARLPTRWHGSLEPAKEGDRLWQRTGEKVERIDGALEEFGAADVRFHAVQVGRLNVPWSEIVAIFVETGAHEEKAAGDSTRAALVPIIVDLVDKSRLHGRLEKLDASTLTFVGRRGQKLVLPVSAIGLVVVDDKSIAFLSDMPPKRAVDSAPFGDDLGMTWPHRVDASVTGTALTVGGKVFTRGIGVHAPSRLEWALDGGFSALRGSCAIDDQVLRLAAHGSVVFRVLVDGTKRWESPILRGGDAPVAIALKPESLSGAKELVFEVDVADEAFVADRADWLQAMLVR